MKPLDVSVDQISSFLSIDKLRQYANNGPSAYGGIGARIQDTESTEYDTETTYQDDRMNRDDGSRGDESIYEEDENPTPSDYNYARDETLWYRDFVNDFNITDFQTRVGKDGATHRSPRGLLIDSTCFRESTPQGHNGSLDNVKWQMYYRDKIQAYGDETIYEGIVSSCQIFDRRPIPKEFVPRVRNIHEDYRLCCGSMMIYDDVTMISASFLITNYAIYAMYERRPGKKTFHTAGVACDHCVDTNNHACFASAVLVQRRGRGQDRSIDILDDKYRLAIGVDSTNGVIRWYIDRIEVFHINRIGYRLDDRYQVLERGGSPKIAKIESFQVGYGHYTFLDHQLPNNYSREMVRKDISSRCEKIYRSESGLVMLNCQEHYRETLPDLYGRYMPIIPGCTFAVTADIESFRLFGQGCVSLIESLRVYTRRRSMAPIICPIREIDEAVENYEVEDTDYNEIMAVDRSVTYDGRNVGHDGDEDSLISLPDDFDVNGKQQFYTLDTRIRHEHPELTSMTKSPAIHGTSNLESMRSLTNVSTQARKSNLSLYTPHPSNVTPTATPTSTPITSGGTPHTSSMSAHTSDSEFSTDDNDYSGIVLPVAAIGGNRVDMEHSVTD